MREMATLTLGDLLKFRRGISWDASQEREESDGECWPVLGIPNVQQQLRLEKVTRIHVPGGTPDPRKVAGPGTILMVGSNGNPARVGNAVYIDEEVAGRGFLFASFLVGADIREGASADSKFLFHFVASPHTQDLLTRSVRGSTGLKNLSQRFVESLSLPDFALPEQRKIAEVLDTIDEAIRKTEEVIAKLQQVKQGLLHDLLTRGIDENGQLRDPDRHPEQFKESPLGRVPKGWEVGPAAKWCDRLTVGVVNSATHAYVDEGIPFIRSQNVKPNKIVRRDVLHVTQTFNKQQSKSILHAGDVVIVRTGYPGTAAVVPHELEGSNCFSLVIASPREAELDPYFLAQYLNSPACKAAVGRMHFGSAQHNFNVGEMRRMPMPLPTIEEQRLIVAGIGVQEARSEHEENQLTKLRLVKQALMDDLLTGRVRVTPLLDGAAE